LRAGGQDDSRGERVAALVTEPGQMTGVGCRHGGGGARADVLERPGLAQPDAARSGS
jgi:hypothetical protein